VDRERQRQEQQEQEFLAGVPLEAAFPGVSFGAIPVPFRCHIGHMLLWVLR